MKTQLLSLLLVAGLLIIPRIASAHCDTKDGPVVAAANRALAEKNVNHVLIWVQPGDEKEIREAFERATRVRELGTEARALADDYFFETLVRLHRNGEGVAYTGVKPSGTPVDAKIIAADKSIATGDLSPLEGLVPDDKKAELKKRFDKAVALKDFEVNDVQAGRKYVEAYVQFFHFAEGGEEGHAHAGGGGHAGHVPWILSAILLVTSVVFAVLYFRKKKIQTGI